MRAIALGSSLLELAEQTAAGAKAAVTAAKKDPDDPGLALACKNWNAAALSATQAYLTATRQDGGRR